MAAHEFETKLAKLWPIEDWADITVIVAVSGGADSVALLRGLHALREAFVASGGIPQGRLLPVHINHHLRGAESDADAEFVIGLAMQLGLPYCAAVVSGDDFIQTSHRDGLEAAAREVRYKLLEQYAGQCGARYIVTAHTADDQAETILHRIIRGTGLRGLSGMPRARRLGCTTLLRPLLTVRRSELVAYLKAIGQTFRYDSSNDNLDFTRNQIRRIVIPLIEETVHPGVVDALWRLGSLAGDAQSIIDEQAEALYERAITRVSADEANIRIAGLAEAHRHLVREMFTVVWRRHDWPMQAMGLDEWELLAAMAIDGWLVAVTLPGNVQANRSYGVLTLVHTNPKR